MTPDRLRAALQADSDTARDQAAIAHLLDIARSLIERPVGPGYVGKSDLRAAAWRLADAGLMLRDLLAAEAITEGCGIDLPTGRGALLPTKVGG